MGHDHKQMSGKTVRMTLMGTRETLRVKQREMTLVRTGGFMKAYEPGKVSYLAERAAVPVILGAPTIRLTFSRKRSRMDKSKNDEVIVTEVTT
jgi:hypothetical protein